MSESAFPFLNMAATRQIITVAQKEFMDNVRGKWVLFLTAVFIILSLIVSYFGATQTGGAAGLQGFRATAQGVLGLSGTLIPILALMLTYATIAGEREAGSLQLLLTMPVTRNEVVLGKLAGLGAVMMVSIAGGLGVAGFIIAAVAGTDGWDLYALFILGSILFAFAFLAVGLFFSTLVAKRSTALGLAVFLWFFFNLIWGLLMFGLAYLAGVPFNFEPGVGLVFPDWWWAADLISPSESFNLFGARVFGVSDFGGFSFAHPSWATAAFGTLIMFIWLIVPTLLSMYRVQGQDL
jgi:Cu-processing system permease protein